MSIITDVIESTKAIIQGMGVTLSYIPKRKWTVEYPDDPVTLQPRYRGQHLLHVEFLQPLQRCNVVAERVSLLLGMQADVRRNRRQHMVTR